MELCEQAAALDYCAFWIRVLAADYGDGEVEEIHGARHDFGATSQRVNTLQPISHNDTTTIKMTERRSTTLVLHPSSTDPTNFLQRETSIPPSNE